MYGVHPRIGKLHLAIGESVCIGETRRPSDFFTAFRPVLLIEPSLVVPPESETGARKELRASERNRSVSLLPDLAGVVDDTKVSIDTFVR